MNVVARAANGLWSAVCMLVACGLFGLFFYWTVLQRPSIQVNESIAGIEYRVPAGSLLYIENPIIPPEAISKVAYSATLVRDQSTKYALASPDFANRAQVESADTLVQSSNLAAPLYAVFIPSYVKPGTYTYTMTASYRLNPFKTSTLSLPPLTIIVE